MDLEGTWRERVEARRAAGELVPQEETVGCEFCGDRGVISWDLAGAYRDVACSRCPKGLSVMGVPRRFVRRNANLQQFEGMGQEVSGWPPDDLGEEEARGWYIFGLPGRGKTHLAVALLRAAAERGRRARFMHVAEYFELLRTAMDDAEVKLRARALAEQLPTLDVVLLDDLGGEYLTGWGMERLLLVVNALYNADAPLIVTSNLSAREQESRLDPRILSRIRGMTKPLELRGPDRRLLPAQGERAQAERRR